MNAPELTLRRRLRPGDFAALAQLTEQSVLPLSARDLTRLVLEDPSAVVIIAELAGAPVGYVHVGAEAGEVYVVSGVVSAAHRRRGIGTALLDAAREQAKTWHAERLVISGRPRGYATPGIDVERDPGTAAFLRGRGGEESGTALAMQRELTDLPVATDPADVAITPCAPEELPELLHVVAASLAEDWARTLATHAAAQASRSPTGNMLIARDLRDPEHPVLGFAAWGTVGADPERFGPIGVTPAARGRRIGGALLDAALVRMQAAGARRAWFQWTSPAGPARALYDSRGFTPLGQTTSFTIPVGPSERTTA